MAILTEIDTMRERRTPRDFLQDVAAGMLVAGGCAGPAAALANARTFGGEDYVGCHTMMALAPSFHMARELPEDRRPLPVLKVLYRNTNRIQEHGGRASEVLHRVKPGDLSAGHDPGEA